jgi:hypothetical protein
MTTELKFWDLIRKVLDRTVKDSLGWEKTPKSNTFQAAFPNFSVSIAEFDGPSPDSDPIYLFAIYDESGKRLDSVSDMWLAKALEPTNATSGSLMESLLRAADQVPAGKVFDTMSTLYKEARRTALGVDEALDQILSSLAESPGD